MTQRIFDVENGKDIADLWNIVPENVIAIEKSIQNSAIYRTDLGIRLGYQYIAINWHNKTEITRPTQEVTEDDFGKLCIFWDDKRFLYFGILDKIEIYDNKNWYRFRANIFPYCRRLTKQEIEDLC